MEELRGSRLWVGRRHGAEGRGRRSGTWSATGATPEACGEDAQHVRHVPHVDRVDVAEQVLHLLLVVENVGVRDGRELGDVIGGFVDGVERVQAAFSRTTTI